MFKILLVGIDLIKKFYVSVVLKVHVGLVKGSSVYMEVGFSEVVYSFWCMIFKVTTGSGWWYRFLGSAQCSGYNDLTVHINWLLFDVVWVSNSIKQQLVNMKSQITVTRTLCYDSSNDMLCISHSILSSRIAVSCWSLKTLFSFRSGEASGSNSWL